MKIIQNLALLMMLALPFAISQIADAQDEDTSSTTTFTFDMSQRAVAIDATAVALFDRSSGFFRPNGCAIFKISPNWAIADGYCMWADIYKTLNDKEQSANLQVTVTNVSAIDGSITSTEVVGTVFHPLMFKEYKTLGIPQSVDNNIAMLYLKADIGYNFLPGEVAEARDLTKVGLLNQSPFGFSHSYSFLSQVDIFERYISYGKQGSCDKNHFWLNQKLNTEKSALAALPTGHDGKGNCVAIRVDYYMPWILETILTYAVPR